MALTPVQEAQVLDLIAQQSALLSLAGVEATILSKLGATKVTLSDLPTASVIDDADLLLLRQGVTDKSVTGLKFKNLIPTIATQAETDTGTDDARFVTPLKLKFGFAYSFTTNGYIKFPSWLGGWTIQWGQASSDVNGLSAITFPIAFSTACLGVIGNHIGTGGAMIIELNGTRTLSGVSLNQFYHNGTTLAGWALTYLTWGK